MGAILQWSKQDVANVLGCTLSQLKFAMGKELPEIEWKKKKQYFNDLEVFNICKKLRPLLKDEQIMSLVYPKGIK